MLKDPQGVRGGLPHLLCHLATAGSQALSSWKKCLTPQQQNYKLPAILNNRKSQSIIDYTHINYDKAVAL